MKKILFAFLFAAVAAASARAQDDLVVMEIRIGKEKPQRVVLDLYEDAAPVTVENFKRLARKRFYKGVAFHRVFPGTLVQAGDPRSRKKDRHGVGTGGPGHTLPPEIGPKHKAGSIAAARLPDAINPSRRSNGSQFYITLKPMPELDGTHTVFGEVIGGMELLDKISRLPVDTNDYPIERVVIRSMKVLPRARVQAIP